MTADEAWNDIWGDSDKEITPMSSYNSMKLAQYFRNKFQAASWNQGFGVTNMKALAGAFAQWKGKQEAVTVMAMVDKYMADPSLRGKNPGWSDFIFRAEQIAASLSSVPVKDKWTLMEEEWERNNGGKV